MISSYAVFVKDDKCVIEFNESRSGQGLLAKGWSIRSDLTVNSEPTGQLQVERWQLASKAIAAGLRAMPDHFNFIPMAQGGNETIWLTAQIAGSWGDKVATVFQGALAT